MRAANSPRPSPDSYCGGTGPRSRVLLIALVTTALIGGAATAGWCARVSELGLPHPLSGPGHPDLKRSVAKKINKSWDRLEAGRSSAATKAARKLGQDPASTLLRHQLALTVSEESPIEELQRLTESSPDYAAAWLTLAVAAERAGDEAVAYAAASRGAELWPEQRWSDRLADLQHRWVFQRVVKAGRLVDGGHPEEALLELDQLLLLEPDQQGARLIEARALLQLRRTDEAVEILETLQRGPEVLTILGQVAEERRDWLRAMGIYAALPLGTPDRHRLLRRAQLQWRRQNLPAYVQEALESVQLTRQELAVLLVGLVPEAQAIGGGRVPVLSDIVDLPSQREILTVVRLEMMMIDRLEHRFHPERMANPVEIQRALDRLCELLGQASVQWCEEQGVISSSCTVLPAPVSGEALGEIILGLAHGEG